MAIKQIENDEEFHWIISSHEFTIICFFIEDEAHSQFISGFQKLADNPNYAGTGFYLIDASSSFELMRTYSITDTPTTLFFKSGEQVDDVVGPNLESFPEVFRSFQ